MCVVEINVIRVCVCVCCVDVCVDIGMMCTPGRDTGDELQLCVCVDVCVVCVDIGMSQPRHCVRERRTSVVCVC